MLQDFESLKSGILKLTKNVSSLREKEGKLNLNCSYARQFMREVLEVTVHHIHQVRKLFDEKIHEVKLLPDEVQAKVYSKFYGPIQFDMKVEQHFSAIRPWVENWIEVQVLSIVQRELLASSRTALEEVLQQNNSKMKNGFKELLASKILEPLISLDELYNDIKDEMDLVAFAFVK